MKCLKPGKAPEAESIFPEFLQNFGPVSTKQLITTMSRIIELMKAGKCGEDPTDYRPLTLICIPFKLL